ncbi:unnamed protein product [Brugia timori]|uniref:Uncharacterized protein n=1 Tax=Brugia timori TaxID=42155 RepID=A0A3P7T9M0_9BILA|nr:unnamed protein product [Brugia timori]
MCYDWSGDWYCSLTAPTRHLTPFRSEQYRNFLNCTKLPLKLPIQLSYLFSKIIRPILRFTRTVHWGI